MPTYQIHTIASAPEKSKPALEQLQQGFGVIPNLAAVIANSPKLVNSLVGVFQQVHSSSFTEPEIQIVLLTDAVANSSKYAEPFLNLESCCAIGDKSAARANSTSRSIRASRSAT